MEGRAARHNARGNATGLRDDEESEILDVNLSVPEEI